MVRPGFGLVITAVAERGKIMMRTRFAEKGCKATHRNYLMGEEEEVLNAFGCRLVPLRLFRALCVLVAELDSLALAVPDMPARPSAACK